MTIEIYASRFEKAIYIFSENIRIKINPEINEDTLISNGQIDYYSIIFAGKIIERKKVKGRKITWTLLQEIYKIAVGEEMKYSSIEVSDQDVIAELAPYCHLGFSNNSVNESEEIDDQIYNYWMKYV